MIKIDWFSNEIREKYFNDLEPYFPDEIVWYGDSSDPNNRYRINTKVLLCGTKDKVINYPYIDLYMSLRRKICIKRNDRSSLEKEINDLINKNQSFFKNYATYLNGNRVYPNYIDALLLTIKTDLDKAMNEVYQYIISKKHWRIITLDSLYDLIRREKRADLMDSLKVDCCPYCNRQYITSLKKKTKKDKLVSTADLDHFYNKSIFPLFALSLFNFVPSCQVCNSRVKGQNWLDAVYPYEEDFGDDAVFTFDYSAMSGKEWAKALISLEPVPVPITISVTAADKAKRQRIENSLELFQILRIYLNHKLYAGELLWKKHLYNDPAYIASLKNTFFQLKHFEMKELDMNLFLYGYRLDKEHKYDKDRPLSKLTYDLMIR